MDDAHALIERSSLSPVQDRYRIFILDECHQLTTQSQNILLKCIEEPPPHVVFMLCTTEVYKVLPTIVSRCQVFHFRALSTQMIAQHLQEVADAEAIAVTDNALMAITRFAEGGLRDAIISSSGDNCFRLLASQFVGFVRMLMSPYYNLAPC